MQIAFASEIPADAGTIACPVAKSAAIPAGIAGGLAGRAASAARFEGESGAMVELFSDAGDRTLRHLLIGLGERDKADGLAMERAGGAVTARLLSSGETHAAIAVGAIKPALDAELAARLAFGALLRAWRIDRYRTRLPAKLKPTLTKVTIVGAPADTEATFARYAAIAEGVALTRELVSEPANIIYPESFVERCRHLGDLGTAIEVLDENAMAKLGMGSLLGVAQGSSRPPRLLVMRWNGAGEKGGAPVALVGKGVTFDTGGISLKPGPGMEDMKWDMGGAGAVAGTMKALALRKARVNVIGVCGLVENMPDGNAQRPGDIVTSMSGQTIEVLNTDAEGRLVLCDAFTWTQQNARPKVMIDLATLTGAMIIALGNEYGGMFSNDDALADALAAAGRESGDPLWRFPLGDAYNKLIDSPIADMKNIGPRNAGSITAAQFLQRFVDEGVRWAHLDIAGMVWADKDGPVWAKGATGYGVRLLERYLADHHEQR